MASFVSGSSGRQSSKHSFLNAFAVLLSGTAFAHAVTALALPFLTRLYKPTDFAILAVFTALLSIISVAACLRFEIAIPIPKNDATAFQLLALSIASSLFISFFGAIFAWIAPTTIAGAFGRPELERYLWMVPIGIFVTGTYAALQNWYVREKQYSLIARSRVLQSIATVGTQIGFAYFYRDPLGLVIGYLLNMGAGCIMLGNRFFSVPFPCNPRSINLGSLKTVAFAFRRYPILSTWEALANSAAIQIPILMIASTATGPEAGYLLLGMSIVQAPMALFGNAISQVYLSKAPHEHRNGNLRSFTLNISWNLAKTGVVPLCLIGCISPAVFGVVFGKEWERAGLLVAWMTPWFIVQFLSSPISMALNIVGAQKTALVLQVFGLFFRIFSVWIASQMYYKPVSEAYAISGFVFYALYLAVLIRKLKDSNLPSHLATEVSQ